VQQIGEIEVKTDAKLGTHKRGVAETASGASGDNRESGDNRLEKRQTLLKKPLRKLVQAK
jgi:hypothetical protein